MEQFGFRQDGSVRTVVVTDDGLFPNTGSLWSIPHDAVTAAYPNDYTEVFTSKQGGAGGDIQEVVTIIYTDNTKEQIVSAVRV